jgi:hypothetical protein
VPLVILTLTLLLVATSFAVTPEEYVRNYYSLDYSTTPWSEPINGLQMRVTYPLELTYGEPLELTVEFACDPKWEAPVRMRRQALYVPRDIELALAVYDVSSGDSLVHTVYFNNESLHVNCWKGFNLVNQPIHSASVRFDAVGGSCLEDPRVNCGPGCAGTAGRVVARYWGLKPGIHPLKLAVLEYDRFAGYVEVATSNDFFVYAHPYTPLMRRLVVIVPRGTSPTADCRLLFTEPETLSVLCDYYDFVGYSVASRGGFGTRSFKGDSVDLVADKYRSESPMWFDSSQAITESGNLDSLTLFVFSTPEPPQHMWRGMSGGKVVLRRVIPIGRTQEERDMILRCRELRMRQP